MKTSLHLSSEHGCMSPNSDLRGGREFHAQEERYRLALAFLSQIKQVAYTGMQVNALKGCKSQIFLNFFAQVGFIHLFLFSNIVYSDSLAEDMIYTLGSQNHHAPC